MQEHYGNIHTYEIMYTWINKHKIHIRIIYILLTTWKIWEHWEHCGNIIGTCRNIENIAGTYIDIGNILEQCWNISGTCEKIVGTLYENYGTISGKCLILIRCYLLLLRLLYFAYLYVIFCQGLRVNLTSNH